MRCTTRAILFAAALAAGGLALPAAARADGWHGRGHGWGPPPRAYHHNHGWRAGEAALGALLGVGAGVVIGSALAPPPPPPPIYYYQAPPPPPVVIYQKPPVVYAPPPGHWVQPPPYWVPR